MKYPTPHCLFTLCMLFTLWITPTAYASTQVQPFQRLEITGHIQALVTAQQDHHSLELLGPKDQLVHIVISNHDGTLRIEDRNHDSHERVMVVAKIDTKQLHAIALSGATHATISNIRGNGLTLNTSGTVQCSVSGNVQHFELNNSGGAHVFASHLKAKQAAVHASGMSRCVLQVLDQLHASASRASTIKYYGQPQLTAHRSGHAKIIALQSLDNSDYAHEKHLQEQLLEAYRRSA